MQALVADELIAAVRCDLGHQLLNRVLQPVGVLRAVHRRDEMLAQQESLLTHAIFLAECVAIELLRRVDHRFFASLNANLRVVIHGTDLFRVV